MFQNLALIIMTYIFPSLTAPYNPLIASNMSHVNVTLGRSHEALKDAELVCHLKPDWPKVRNVFANKVDVKSSVLALMNSKCNLIRMDLPLWQFYVRHCNPVVHSFQ